MSRPPTAWTRTWTDRNSDGVSTIVKNWGCDKTPVTYTLYRHRFLLPSVNEGSAWYDCGDGLSWILVRAGPGLR